MGATVRGASHERTGQPNQDAWRSWSSPDGLQVVAAVADGHGSPRSFRSHIGARLAVAAAICEGSSFLEAHQDDDIRPDDEQWRDLELDLDNLDGRIVFRWDQKVRERWRRLPPTPEELQGEPGQALPRPQGDQDGQGLAPDGALAYGTTLLVAFATSSFLAFLQLGDGDILAVSTDGKVERAVERDERFIGNQTASMAMRNAGKQFRSKCWPYRQHLPGLVLLSTDGYANSYSNEDTFREVAADYFRQIQKHGMEEVGKRLKTWLEEVTAGGSGDDVTVGLVAREQQEPGEP